MSSEEGWLKWLLLLPLRSPAMVVKASSKALFYVNPWAPIPPTPPFLSPSPDLVVFHGTYQEAVRKAEREFKFLIIYLQSSVHEDTQRFRSQVLGSPAVVDFLNQNFLFYGIDVNTHPLGNTLATSLGVTRFPALKVICHVSNSAMTRQNLARLGYQPPNSSSTCCLLSMQGYIEPSHLIARLTAFNETHSSLIQTARAEIVERRQTRTVVQEQDEAYLRSLQEDKEKRERKLREEQAIAEAERLKKEEEERIQKEIAIKKEAALVKEKKVAARRSSLSRLVGEEPPAGPDSLKVSIRFSDGKRVVRRFLKEDQLAELFLWIASIESSSDYDIVTHFPRSVLTDALVTFKEANLSVVFVEEKIVE
eukprot:TRINITY_DN10491_c0_g1_i1.p1 TRINITY_DN10491_c0_g1~~TRINITY_DN10491_c0_g1_i1.p1  ORF type:complete len:395 (+),score=101.09 TRINITY_DN10491_c0_g1_i1:93-1187(+)